MKKTMLCATVLALSVAATGCASGKKAESSAASTAAAQTEAASTTAAGKTAETTATAVAASDMAVPGYAPGQIPEIPAIVLPELGISENPAAKITLDKTKALSSVPGITVTPVRVENNQIQRGSTVMQLGSNG